MDLSWKSVSDGTAASNLLVGDTVSIGKYVTTYAVPHPRRTDSLSTSLWEPQISKCGYSSGTFKWRINSWKRGRQ